MGNSYANGTLSIANGATTFTGTGTAWTTQAKPGDVIILNTGASPPPIGIVASITDMGPVPAGSVHLLWSAHNLEHLEAPEVPLALAEFARVLVPDGFAVISVPNLAAVAEAILKEGPGKPVQRTPAGPVTPLDMLYGYGPYLRGGHRFMAHRTGFTAESLAETLLELLKPVVADFHRLQSRSEIAKKLEQFAARSDFVQMAELLDEDGPIRQSDTHGFEQAQHAYVELEKEAQWLDAGGLTHPDRVQASARVSAA